MLRIQVRNDRQVQEIDHSSGALELGRGPQRSLPRITVEDSFVSRDHLEVEERPRGRVRIKNLSQRQQVTLPDGSRLSFGEADEIDLPCPLRIGATQIKIEAGEENEPEAGEDFKESHYLAIAPAGRESLPTLSGASALSALGDSPPPETIASWLETVITLQRSPAESQAFYAQTARALVELVGLDLGMVILRWQNNWEIAGFHSISDRVCSRYSRTLLNHVVTQRCTFYQDLKTLPVRAESLADIAAVVASPIFGLNEEVAGVLYGSRSWRGRGVPGIRPLEAQVVQLLAAAVGANLARTTATRTRVQFEQFFSSELVRELERDPKLLEGRHQEVTILVSDMRGFTALSERLGPETSCAIVRDLMEPLSERIAEHGGVIVDYAGDGILAMWNAPVSQPDHAVRACRAALAMLAELPPVNARWQQTVGAPLAIGIGINTGPARVGNTGSSRKLKYGPHGLTVNFASRIQSATKQVGVPLLVSDSVRALLPHEFTTRPTAPVHLPGISEDVVLYELGTDQSINTMNA